jgi:hypothetical protein
LEKLDLHIGICEEHGIDVFGSYLEVVKLTEYKRIWIVEKYGPISRGKKFTFRPDPDQKCMPLRKKQLPSFALSRP